MNHRSKVHPSNRKYRNFLTGNCPHADGCWYVHDETSNAEDSFENFKCELCANGFKGRNNYMMHKKFYHPLSVPQCESFKQGKCPKGGNECWFEHNFSENIKMTDKVWPKINQNSPVKSADPVFCEASGDTFPPDQLSKIMKMIGNLCNKVQKMEDVFKDLIQ